MVPIRSHLAASRSALSRARWGHTVPSQQDFDVIPEGCSRMARPFKVGMGVENLGLLPKATAETRTVPGNPGGIKQPSGAARRPAKAVWLRLLLGLVTALALPGRAADLSARFDEFLRAQTNVQSWCADFIQTRALKVLA